MYRSIHSLLDEALAKSAPACRFDQLSSARASVAFIGGMKSASFPLELAKSPPRKAYTRDAYADISFAVMHKLAERPAPARRHSSSRKLVNNCAAGDNFAGGRPAPARTRSRVCNPKRIDGRLPVEPEALAPTSNRKTPQEGHHISLG